MGEIGATHKMKMYTAFVVLLVANLATATAREAVQGKLMIALQTWGHLMHAYSYSPSRKDIIFASE